MKINQLAWLFMLIGHIYNANDKEKIGFLHTVIGVVLLLIDVILLIF